MYLIEKNFAYVLPQIKLINFLSNNKLYYSQVNMKIYHKPLN